MEIQLKKTNAELIGLFSVEESDDYINLFINGETIGWIKRNGEEICLMEPMLEKLGFKEIQNYPRHTHTL